MDRVHDYYQSYSWHQSHDQVRGFLWGWYWRVLTARRRQYCCWYRMRRRMRMYP
ncbi:uncharacterized protein B0H18DRAFT_1103682 [Fomitopsis serialis]|uniref:uncharacterized protein n=1 Tax=Fomitopsis serialis TaxID=139415 RepID=UPI002007D36E|nr:uncharacterized protein B0H18DRAFT_1103682 [Neoantrodia serialis]KAH9928621.1 hypothetical protein B0H18DRAFT_1103682 [Neoantrodia serialis]